MVEFFPGDLRVVNRAVQPPLVVVGEANVKVGKAFYLGSASWCVSDNLPGVYDRRLVLLAGDGYGRQQTLANGDILFFSNWTLRYIECPKDVVFRFSVAFVVNKVIGYV